MSTYEPDLSSLQRTADHWDAWQRELPQAQGLYKDWGDHPTVFQALMRHVFGRITGAVGPIARSTLEAMIAMDPSEAVRSGELHGMLRDHFDFLDDFALGGSLLHLLLNSDFRFIVARPKASSPCA